MPIMITVITIYKSVRYFWYFNRLKLKMISGKFQTRKLKSLSHLYTTVANQEFESVGPENAAHPYKKSLFSNVHELLDNLKKNVIYNKNDLIVVNKPYGLKKEQERNRGVWEKKIVVTQAPVSADYEHLSFTDILPQLANELEADSLKFVKTPERYTSGVTLLSNSDYVERIVSKCFNASNKPVFTHLVVCRGIPVSEQGSIKIGLTLTGKEKSKTKKAVFVTDYSKRLVKRNLVLPFVCHHKVLSVNTKLNVSLVEIHNNRNKWHAVRVFCSTRLLAPILGDNLFGSRVQTVNGVAVLVDPENPVASMVPRIPPNLLTALELRKSESQLIPVCIHLSQINLTRLYKKGCTFVASPPNHFLWTCKKLNLEVPTEYLENQSLNVAKSLPSFE